MYRWVWISDGLFAYVRRKSGAVVWDDGLCGFNAFLVRFGDGHAELT